MKAHLSELVEAVLRGEDVVISRRDVPLVRLSAVSVKARGSRLGGRKGRGWIADDFDAPMEDFGAYTK